MTKVINMRNPFTRLAALFDLNAWAMILLGLVLFASRVQLTNLGWVNLPVAFTVLQTAGLMFCLFGLQIMASCIFWPSIKVSKLLEEVEMHRNTAAGLVILGLLTFNGLATIGFAIWLTSALGAGVGSGGT